MISELIFEIEVKRLLFKDRKLVIKIIITQNNYLVIDIIINKI